MHFMISSIGHAVIFGLPIALYFGIITFICLSVTVVIGMLVLRGLYNIPFKWHMRMAGVTLFFLAIHITLITWQFFF
jgi:hypothetical protein